MRVALVAAGYAPAVGGVEHHVEQLATGLLAAGDEVTVVTNRLEAHHPRRQLLGGVEVRRFPLNVTATDYRYSAAMAAFLRGARERFDVVHAHSYHTLAALNVVLAGVPRMVFTPHYHGTGHSPFRALLHRPYRLVGARVLSRSSAVVCVTHAEAERLCADFPRVADRITVIPNGTRPPCPSPEAVASSIVSADDVVTVGRLVAYKGVDLLVRAVAELPPPTRLVAIGSGPAEHDLRRLAHSLGVADRVVLAGRLTDEELQAAIVRAGVVVSMSEHEAFGLCVADGIAAGAPVLASDIPAHREVFALAGDQVVGALVAGSDPAALASAVRRLLDGPRPTAGATSLPTWADVVEQTRGVYAAVGDRRRAVPVSGDPSRWR